MALLTLVVGNKNYSSWSLRPWLLLRQTGVPFTEVRIPLYRADTLDELRAWSPSGLVPLLQDGDLKVWDSLAICEYLDERFPEHQLWPEDIAARAPARSVSAEMHAGFGALRQGPLPGPGAHTRVPHGHRAHPGDLDGLPRALGRRR